MHPSLAPLEGGVNFRDMGGYLAADGRRVKRGRLFRSGALDRLTDKDLSYLQEVPIKNILDYRDADEVSTKPDVLWDAVRYINLPANPLSTEVNANLEKLTSEALESFDANCFYVGALPSPTF